MPTSLAVQASKNSLAYLKALATSIVIAIVFFGFFYYITLRPLQEMRYQIDEAMRGKRKNLESHYLMAELGPLRNNINTLLQRLRELQNQTDDASFDEVESDLPYLQTLEQFLEGAGVPAMILDSQKKVKRINAEAEDLCGIREASSIDQDFLEVAREKGLGATVTELCDLSAGNNGASEQGEYELSGKTYHIYVKAMMGHDSFAKGFYLTFISDAMSRVA
jgi:signal transduction histidine kinase